MLTELQIANLTKIYSSILEMLMWKDQCDDTDRQNSRFFTMYTKSQTKLLVSIPTLLCLLQTKGNTFKARQMTFKPPFDHITSKLKEGATTVYHKKRTNQNLNTCRIVGASHKKYSNPMWT
jgi:hypothetical protein